MMKITALAGLAASILWLSVHAYGQTVGSVKIDVPCGDSAVMLDALKAKYRENEIISGKAGYGAMKLLANLQTGTYTVGFDTGRLFCIVIAGTNLTKITDGQSL